MRTVAIYRLGSKAITEHFFADFTDLLECLTTRVEPIMTMGDVKFRLDCPAESSSVKFINLLNTFGLCQHVTKTTYDGGGLLDVIITRVDERFERPCVVDIGLSDYQLVKGSISITPPQPIYETVSSRSWRSFDTNIFRLDVMSSSLNPLVDGMNMSPSDLVEQYKKQFLSICLINTLLSPHHDVEYADQIVFSTKIVEPRRKR